jgi:hypothetical protein
MYKSNSKNSFYFFNHLIWLAMILTLFACKKQEKPVPEEDGTISSITKTSTQDDKNISPALQEYNKAKDKGRYSYLLFTEKGNPSCNQMEQNLNDFAKQTKQKVNIIVIDRKDPKNMDIVQQFGTQTAPIPLTLLCNKNGSVAFVFSKIATADELEFGFPSPSKEAALEYMYQGKGVVICFYVDSMTTKKDAEDLCIQAKNKLEGKLQYVAADLSDPKEVSFLGELRMSPNFSQPMIVVINASGQVMGKFNGNFTVDNLVLAATAKPKAGGCCPKGSGKTCAVPANTKKKS